eukprot:TRINITY_DN10052_c0_g1_i4.p4 TRINITY_DN10052_c0_g1~~TRINITY_DN10052_c0_g1_i4.p4  ORF type:complete len:109 (+),score=1.59 TRINITY_DN10052_c0_g1_i4:77-403(+)
MSQPSLQDFISSIITGCKASVQAFSAATIASKNVNNYVNMLSLSFNRSRINCTYSAFTTLSSRAASSASIRVARCLDKSELYNPKTASYEDVLVVSALRRIFLWQKLK